MIRNDPLITPLDDDPDFRVSDWQYEVANGDTLRGYQDWVAAQKEAQADYEAFQSALPMSERGLSKNLNPILSSCRVRQAFIQHCKDHDDEHGVLPVEFSVETPSGVRSFSAEEVAEAKSRLFAERTFAITEEVTYTVKALDEQAALSTFLLAANRDELYSPRVFRRDIAPEGDARLRPRGEAEEVAPTPGSP